MDQHRPSRPQRTARNGRCNQLDVEPQPARGRGDALGRAPPSFVPGKGWGSYSFTEDPQADAMVEELKRAMDPAKREELIRKIARDKQEKVLGGLSTYRPMVTLAWRSPKVEFTPWPYPGYCRGFQEISVKQ